MVFIEQDYWNPVGTRLDRFWAAYEGTDTVSFPLVIADSGHEWSCGHVDHHAVYSAMVDREMARAPQAEIEAYYQRTGDQVRATIRLRNQSGAPLSTARNDATVHLIVYEDAHVGTTGRIVRAAPYVGIETELAPDAVGAFTLETLPLSGVDWGKLHVLALVDYRPRGETGPYDMLQAVFAAPRAFAAQPDRLAFMVDAANPTATSMVVTLQGAFETSWAAEERLSWLSVTPISGTMNTPATLAVLPSALAPGWQGGAVEFTGTTVTGLTHTVTVDVRAYLGKVERAFVPVVRR